MKLEKEFVKETQEAHCSWQKMEGICILHNNMKYAPFWDSDPKIKFFFLMASLN